MLNSPMVSISVNLEGSFSSGAVVTEQLLECDDTSNGQRHFTGNEGFTGNGGEGLQSHASYNAHGCENTEQQVWQDLLSCGAKILPIRIVFKSVRYLKRTISAS